MRQINFSCGRHFYTAGHSTEVKTLDEVNVTSTTKENLPWLQVFDTDYRISSDNIDWNKWNGCCFIDIDSKHFYEEVKRFKVDKVGQYIFDRLSEMSCNFYCYQKSNSGTGYHFIFYFDVEKNETNFRKAVQYAKELVTSAFESHPATSQIIHYKKVLDNCSISPYQGMYLTNHPIIYNDLVSENDFGSWEWIENYELQERIVVKVDRVLENTVNFKGFKVNNKDVEVKYYEHLQRWHIYNSLIPCFGSENEVNMAWNNFIVPFLAEGNGHRKSFYYNEPIKNKWFERYNTSFVNEKYLEDFGFSFEKTFKPKQIQIYNPDKILNLTENQRLTDVNIPFTTKKINHLYAGCGLGKTYMSKQLGTNLDELDYIFNGQKRVCVIVPLKSISKNSFEDDNEWVCIDGDTEDVDKRHILRETRRNVCTTWESFVLYNMNEISFDYVIVDEIHTLYMYDYRVNSVSMFKNAIRNCNSNYTIFMTGTPSYEVEEFDCYKIQIKREDKKVPCDMIVYNKSYLGWLFEDIREWTKDENHIALVFKDTTNYKTQDKFELQGLDCDIFNKSYLDSTDYILTNENIKKQITAFSVYGQAGINLYIDTNKKARIYIINDNGLGTIQYANRVRNKEVIDKVVVFYKKDKIDSDVKSIKIEKDIPEAERKLKILSSIKREYDVMRKDNYSVLKYRYGFNKECVNWELLTLNEQNYENFCTIKGVLDYERQIQVIYNRLVEAFFDVNVIYLDKDVKTKVDTAMRTNQFAGQMIRFNTDMIQLGRNNNIVLKTTEQFNKIVTGDLVRELNYVLNSLYVENDRDITKTKDEFVDLIKNIVKVKKTIKKADISNLKLFYSLKEKWESYYDKVFIKIMMNPEWSDIQISSVFMRTIYNENMTDEDWKVLLEETYQQIVKIRKIVLENKEIFEQLDREIPVENMTFKNDKMVGKFLRYLDRRHTTGKQTKNTKRCIVKGVEFNSINDAAKYFNVRRETINRWIKQGL